jgi:hypothetical protein
MGLPTCFALEASLADMILGDDKMEVNAATNKADRINFYLKVEPKSKRKPTRTSTLDRANSRRDLIKQIASSRSLDSTQFLGARAQGQVLYQRDPLRTSSKEWLHTRSISATPIPTTF